MGHWARVPQGRAGCSVRAGWPKGVQFHMLWGAAAWNKMVFVSMVALDAVTLCEAEQAGKG